MNRTAGWTWSLTLLIGLAAHAASEDTGARERTFVRALEVFDQARTPEEFRQAAELFRGLVADGYANGAIYYNLGNAYLKAGEYGKAIWAYRKARHFRPRDPYLDANLRQALLLAPGRLPDTPPPWWTHVLFWTRTLSYPEKAYATTSAFVAAALLATLAMLLRKRRVYWASAMFVLVGGLLGLDAAMTHNAVHNAQHAVVVRETVARKGIGKHYEPAFTQPLKDGAEFRIIDRSGEWVFGHFEGVGDGWLRRDDIIE